MAETPLPSLSPQPRPGRNAAGWRWRPALLGAVACCLAATASLQAVPIPVPTGLAPGDNYRLAFVTSTTRDATSSAIADYNDFVTAAALAVPELAALGTT